MFNINKLFLLAAMAVLAVSCSSGENPLATSPDNPENLNPQLAWTSGDNTPGRTLWGYFSWVMDTENETFEAVPLRSAEMHLNVSKFIDAFPTKFSFSDFSVDHTASTISLDVGITHPFPGKPNLAGFDVRGILIGAGTVSGFEDSTLVLAGNNDAHLANPDGWTRWWNPVDFTNSDAPLFSYRDGIFGIKNDVGNYNCTLNGYKIFTDDLGKTEDPDGLSLVDRAVFSPGSTNARRYTIFFPQEDGHFILHYNYAVDVCWAPIPGYVPGNPVSIPGDYPTEANQPEPFRMDVEVEYNSLFYVDATSKGGTAVLHVKIFDWQGYLNTGDTADEISMVKIEAPDCLDASITSGPAFDTGADPQAYAEYEIQIDGANLNTHITSDALLTVVSANGDYQPSLTGFSGAQLSAYEIFQFPEIANVAPQNQFPMACATADKDIVIQGESVIFDGSCSNDPDGIILSWDWDFDGDGLYGDPFNGGDQTNPEVIYTELGDFDVDLRVTDDKGGIDYLDDLLPILVVEPDNFPPEAVATSDTTEIYPGESVSFDGSGSNDSDGVVVKWEWDFDGDGTYGDTYDSGTDQAPVVIFNVLGAYDVDLMVTDDDDATDVLNTKITIYVVSPDNIAPVAEAEVITAEIWEDVPAEFNATGSYDPDGTVDQWLWDFDEDGIYGDPIDGGTPANPLKAFSGGLHTIDLKVIDNGGKSDYLDVPLQIDVIPHVEITLPEDQDYKSANGYEYLAMVCDEPEDIPIDYTDLGGPWDFTGFTYLPDPDYVRIFAPGSDEIDQFESAFPDTVQYYIRYDIYGDDLSGWLTLAEEADIANDLLYIHGHIEQVQPNPEGATMSYNEDAGGPMAIQYPYNIFTNVVWELNFLDGPLPVIKLTYVEDGVGEGIATVPFDSGWITRALLSRTLYVVEIADQIAAQVLIYKWTADDGKQIARLYTINTPDEYNFDTTTFEILGSSRLVVLNDEF